MKVAIDIKWITDGYDDVILPTEIEIPEDIEDDFEAISDYLSDMTGFLHSGYVLENI